MSESAVEIGESIDMLVGTGAVARVLVVRLGPGADLYRSLEELARRQNIKAGVILSGMANLRRAALRNLREIPEQFPVTDDNRIFITKDEAMELVALTGNFSRRDGQVHLHAHAMISTGSGKGRVFGGHLLEGTIVISLAEIIIADLSGINMLRRVDPYTRAAELYFE